MFTKYFILIVFHILFIRTDPILQVTPKNEHKPETRRILRGREAGDTRPYMVYLRPADPELKTQPDWLCGGVIVDERYVITSAACIENMNQFYVVAGTSKYVSPNDNSNDCIKNGAKKAIWKCISKSYMYAGEMYDNIRWMSNDIAVVQVESEFNFRRRIKGCDYIPSKIAFNNISIDYEKPGSIGSLAGWGATERYNAPPMKTEPGAVREGDTKTSPTLLEADIILLSKETCKKHWDSRYHYIIDESIVCGKDESGDTGVACNEQDVNCEELGNSCDNPEPPKSPGTDNTRRSNGTYTVNGTVSSNKTHVNGTRRTIKYSPIVHMSRHMYGTRRGKHMSGGFCENDHGGPLVIGRGKSSVVVGIISACLTRGPELKCAGPFLFTSIWKNKQLIACALERESGKSCSTFLRSGVEKPGIHESYVEWSEYNSSTGITSGQPNSEIGA